MEARIRRLEDIQEIEHLQKRYQLYFGILDVEKISDCFSKKDPNVSCEISDRGKDIGISKIRESFQHKWEVSRAQHGIMSHLMVLNSVTEVDKKGKTAVGLWYGFGPLSAPITAQNELTAIWNLGKYDMEYIKEDGEWKILHLHFYLIFRTPFDQGWVKQPQAEHGLVSAQIDNLSTQHKPYNPNIINEFLPGPPEPQKFK